MVKGNIKNKFVPWLIILVMVANVAISTISVNAVEGTPDMQAYVEAMQPGWNLGNTFDATGDETSWGNPITTKELINAVAAQGFKSIRIPVTWDQRIGSAPEYTIDPEFLARLKEVIDWSLDAGLYVMLDMHHDSWLWVINMKSQHDEVLARYNAVWRQISEYFKNYPNTLMFESINEPSFTQGWSSTVDPTDLALLDELNTSFYNIVRNSGGNNATRPLVLPTLGCSPTEPQIGNLIDTISKLNDKNIIATVHYYGYWPFSANVAGTTTFDETTKKDLEDTIDRVYNAFMNQGIPVIIGEYGLLGFDKSLDTIEHGEVLKYFEYLTYYANAKDITLMLWDNGQHFNRYSFAWSDPDLYNVIMAGFKERSSYTERDFIYLKKGLPIQDVNTKVYLNGNSLLCIKNGDEILSDGVDYSITQDTLTFKSSLLQRLVTGQFGVNSILTCDFSKGADWKIKIIYYDVPALKESTGTTSGFFIPTDFNGDSLATMEATYTSGGNAGPQDWTPFKEFGYAFTPLYDSNQIKLTKEFFDETRDGEILLKMHFWSGNVIEYIIQKAGTTVTGHPLTPVTPPPSGDTTPPAVPTGLTATAVSSSSINLDWADNTDSDLAGYKVYRSTTSNFTPGSANFVKQVTTSAYTDTGLTADTTYYYKVTAVDTSGNESQPSAQASAKTQQDGGTTPPGEYNEISLPFTHDGAGEYYWKTNKLSTDPNDWSHYINSWNLDLLEINGKDYTNVWVAQHQIAPSSDGYWYIHYKGSASYSHIEIK
jgi:aryl-phospho-beta-D-glucosidase BglC (GH1 family)